MPKEKTRKMQAGTVTAIRLDDRLRYLTEIAAACKGMNLTDYIAWAIDESFSKVSLHIPTEPEIVYNDFSQPPTVIYPNTDDEKSLWEANLISAQADQLWSENRFIRLWSQSNLAPHTLNDDKRAFFEYLQTRNDLWIPARALPGIPVNDKAVQPDRERIHREYDEIRTAFEKQRQAKGRKK